MKRNHLLSTCAVCACTSAYLFAAPGLRAEDLYKSSGPARVSVQPSSELNEFGSVRKASDLIGMEVRNRQNQKIGEVKDLLVDLHSGRAPFAVLSSGGFMGVGDRLMAIPSGVFDRGADRRLLVVTVDDAKLKSAPAFDRNQWPDTANRAWATEVYRYYGQAPYWDVSTGNLRAESTTTSVASPVVVSEESEIVVHPGFASDRSPRRGLGAEDLAGREMRLITGETIFKRDTYFTRQQGATATRDASISEPAGSERTVAASASVGSFSPLMRASHLIGMEVKSPQNERVGEIKDLVLDLRTSRIAYAVLSAGGFLGIADRQFSVAPASFASTSNGRSLVLNVDRDRLKNGPAFDHNRWTEQSTPAYASEVYQYYGQQPYWRNGAASLQRNTGGEVRDPAGAEIRRNAGPGETNGWQKGYYYQDKSRIDSRTHSSDSKDAVPDIHSDTYRLNRPEAASKPSEFRDPSGAERSASVELQDRSSNAVITNAPGTLNSAKGGAEALQSPGSRSEVKDGAIIAPATADRVVTVDPNQPRNSDSLSRGGAGELQNPGSRPEVRSSTVAPATNRTEAVRTDLGIQSGPTAATDNKSRGGSEELQRPGSRLELRSTEPVPAAPLNEAAGAERKSTAATATIDDQAGNESDRQLARRVRTALEANPAMAPSLANVKVNARNGKLVLTGSVASHSEKRNLEQQVKDLGAGAQVDNQLEVKAAVGTEPGKAQ